MTDWTKSKMINRFLNDLLDCKEMVNKKYLPKMYDGNDNINKEIILQYQALEGLIGKYYSTIAFLMKNDEEKIKCPNCVMGYATITANENIACDHCDYTFYPKYVWWEDKELNTQSVSKLLKANKRYQKIEQDRKNLILK
ncbi:hypothetical protein [Bacillus sp. FJAT-47783]|uniref:hypothetical protein n=1 Tax=Bacillus sp. FJAT-47783 TaxID=2922712 RepID=UPI001FAC6D32|nr:hypothetical protein [Bacillus sp. FJAT-47783]